MNFLACYKAAQTAVFPTFGRTMLAKSAYVTDNQAYRAPFATPGDIAASLPIAPVNRTFVAAADSAERRLAVASRRAFAW